MMLNPESTALLIIDMQKAFCKPTGSLYSERCEAVAPKVGEVLKRVREEDTLIIYTKDVHKKEFTTQHYNEFERWGKHCVNGSKETEIIPSLEPKKGEPIIEKNTYDGFHKTRMNDVLKSNGIKTVLVTGVLTNVCVLHTASSAALHDYQPIVLSDCTDALKDSHKEYALNHIEFLFGDTMKAQEIKFET